MRAHRIANYQKAQPKAMEQATHDFGEDDGNKGNGV